MYKTDAYSRTRTYRPGVLQFKKNWSTKIYSWLPINISCAFSSSYFIVTSKLVRPGQIYKLSVRLYHARHPIHVRASIQRNGVELSSNMQHVKENIPETLIMRVCNPLWSYLFRFLDSIIVKDLMQNTKKKKKILIWTKGYYYSFNLQATGFNILRLQIIIVMKSTF